MSKNKSSISQGKSYKAIGEFWDKHDLDEFWDQTHEAEFDVNIESEIMYYSLNKSISDEIQIIARRKGISPKELIERWMKEKVKEEAQ